MEQLCCSRIMIKQFLKSVAAVNPAKLIIENLKIQEGRLHVCDKMYDVNDNIYLIGFGKAVVGMARQCEKILGGRLKRGVIVGPENIQRALGNNSLKPNSVINVYEGGRNNLPDENAEKGADAVIELVKSLNKKNDNLIVLISGGGSALLPKPKPPVSLQEKLQTTSLLFSLGADIYEVNTVRKKLSLVKGGGLACLTYPLKTICLIISDVIDDPLDIIASGPTVPNFDGDLAAFDILQKYSLTNKVPVNVLNKTKEASPRLNFPIVNNTYSHVDNFLIGNNTKALKAGKNYSETQGYKTVILSTTVKGSVDIISNFYINMLFEILNCLKTNKLIDKETVMRDCSFKTEENFLHELNGVVRESSGQKKICILAGGETTVKVTGSGKGGRNQELVLIFCMKLHKLKTEHPHLFDNLIVMFLSAGTDGADGPTDAAGAIGDTSVIEKATRSNLDPNEYLKQNDSYNFFKHLDNGFHLIKTGHTGTNVMDVHSLVIQEGS